MRQRGGDDAAEIGGAGPQRQAKDRQGNGRLGDGGHGHLAAGAHPAESRTRIQAGQRQEEGAQQKQINDNEQVAAVVERQRRGDAAGPARSPPAVLAKTMYGAKRNSQEALFDMTTSLPNNLAQFKVGLPGGRAAPVLQAGLDPAHKTDQPRRQQERQQGLRHFQKITSHIKVTITVGVHRQISADGPEIGGIGGFVKPPRC